jgi:hypothetical protein
MFKKLLLLFAILPFAAEIVSAASETFLDWSTIYGQSPYNLQVRITRNPEYDSPSHQSGWNHWFHFRNNSRNPVKGKLLFTLDGHPGTIDVDLRGGQSENSGNWQIGESLVVQGFILDGTTVMGPFTPPPSMKDRIINRLNPPPPTAPPPRPNPNGSFTLPGPKPGTFGGNGIVANPPPKPIAPPPATAIKPSTPGLLVFPGKDGKMPPDVPSKGRIDPDGSLNFPDKNGKYPPLAKPPTIQPDGTVVYPGAKPSTTPKTSNGPYGDAGKFNPYLVKPGTGNPYLAKPNQFGNPYLVKPPETSTSGNKFAAPDGNKFAPPNGNKFAAPVNKTPAIVNKTPVTSGNKFAAPNGNKFAPPNGNKFAAPVNKTPAIVNRTPVTSGNEFAAPNGNKFATGNNGNLVKPSALSATGNNFAAKTPTVVVRPNNSVAMVKPVVPNASALQAQQAAQQQAQQAAQRAAQKAAQQRAVEQVRQAQIAAQQRAAQAVAQQQRIAQARRILNSMHH